MCQVNSAWLRYLAGERVWWSGGSTSRAVPEATRNRCFGGLKFVRPSAMRCSRPAASSGTIDRMTRRFFSGGGGRHSGCQHWRPVVKAGNRGMVQAGRAQRAGRRPGPRFPPEGALALQSKGPQVHCSKEVIQLLRQRSTRLFLGKQEKPRSGREVLSGSLSYGREFAGGFALMSTKRQLPWHALRASAQGRQWRERRSERVPMSH